MPQPAEKDVISGMVALIGPPNVGKSTLLNNLLGQKISIVSPKPQTTRTRNLGILNGPDYQVVLLDTPGIHQAGSPLNRNMVRVAVETLAEVDAIIFMVDVTFPLPGQGEVATATGHLKGLDRPAILVINKIDLVGREQLLPILLAYQEVYPFKALLPISALQDDGTALLLKELLPLLPTGPRLYPEDIPTDASERFIVGELIREKIFLLTGQEIPYSTAVTVDSFKEDPGRGLVTIHATIYVEKGSQKAIVIGKQGSELQQIGRAARIDIEAMLDQKVFLKLFIKVRKNWTRDDTFLRDMGL